MFLYQSLPIDFFQQGNEIFFYSRLEDFTIANQNIMKALPYPLNRLLCHDVIAWPARSKNKKITIFFSITFTKRKNKNMSNIKGCMPATSMRLPEPGERTCTTIAITISTYCNVIAYIISQFYTVIAINNNIVELSLPLRLIDMTILLYSIIFNNHIKR